MTYLFIPIALTIVFVIYVLYLAVVRKNLKTKMKTIVLPGFIFIAIWAVMYCLVLK
jgi:hypothetical protein